MANRPSWSHLNTSNTVPVAPANRPTWSHLNTPDTVYLQEGPSWGHKNVGRNVVDIAPANRPTWSHLNTDNTYYQQEGPSWGHKNVGRNIINPVDQGQVELKKQPLSPEKIAESRARLEAGGTNFLDQLIVYGDDLEKYKSQPAVEKKPKPQSPNCLLYTSPSPRD